MFFSSNAKYETEREYVELLYSYCMDGIIIDSFCGVSTEKDYAKFLSDSKYSEKHIPVVSIER